MTARIRTPSRVTQVALAIIAVQLVVRGVLVSRSWFLVDDYTFLGDIAQGEDDLAWYLRLHQGHFMPLSFLLVKVVAANSAPYDWNPVVVQVVVLQALASLACWWMLRTLFGPSRAALVGLAVYATSALTMPALMWWAVAINQYPHQIAFFGVLTAHVLYARTRRLLWVAVASLFLAVGYLSYAKTGLIVITLALLTLIWLVDGGPWDRFWSALRRFWVPWLAYGALSVAWLLVYVSRPQPRLPGRSSQFVELAQAGLFEAAIPTVLGGPLQWVLFAGGPIQFADPPLWVVVATTTLLALVLLHAWGTRARSLLVLWPVGVYLFASAMLIYTGRAYTVGLLGGAGVGIHVQYFSDAAPLLVLAGVSLFRPVLDVADPSTLRPEPLARLALPRLAAAGVVALVVAGGLTSSFVYAAPYTDFPERSTNQRAISELRDAEGVQLTDTLAPATIISPLLGENALLRNYFAPLRDSFTTSTAGADLQTLDDDGRLVPADVVPPEGAEAAPEIDGCRDVGIFGRRFRIDPPPVLGAWLVVEYWSDEPGTMSVGGVGTTHVGIDAPAGLRRVLVSAPAPRDRVVVTASADTELCVTRVEYGVVEPT